MPLIWRWDAKAALAPMVGTAFKYEDDLSTLVNKIFATAQSGDHVLVIVTEALAAYMANYLPRSKNSL